MPSPPPVAGSARPRSIRPLPTCSPRRPGDWRFDLVMLAFGCLVRPDACEPAAAALVTEAVRAECPDDVAALMMACQVLRMTSMIAARSPDDAARACGRMVAALDPWLR